MHFYAYYVCLRVSYISIHVGCMWFNKNKDAINSLKATCTLFIMASDFLTVLVQSFLVYSMMLLILRFGNDYSALVSSGLSEF